MTTTQSRLTGPMSLRLRNARIQAGLSVKSLHLLTGISIRAINYYEDPRYSGARKSLAVKAWADATGRDFEELFGTPERPLARTGWLRPTADLAHAS